MWLDTKDKLVRVVRQVPNGGEKSIKVKVKAAAEKKEKQVDILENRQVDRKERKASQWKRMKGRSR